MLPFRETAVSTSFLCACLLSRALCRFSVDFFKAIRFIDFRLQMLRICYEARIVESSEKTRSLLPCLIMPLRVQIHVAVLKLSTFSHGGHCGRNQDYFSFFFHLIAFGTGTLLISNCVKNKWSPKWRPKYCLTCVQQLDSFMGDTRDVE